DGIHHAIVVAVLQRELCAILGDDDHAAAAAQGLGCVRRMLRGAPRRRLLGSYWCYVNKCAKDSYANYLSKLSHSGVSVHTHARLFRSEFSGSCDPNSWQ